MPAENRTQLIDSPWFWALMFALFALALLTIFGDKYRQRQTQIEQRFQSKERREAPAAPQEKALPATKPYSSPNRLIISLWPLIVFLIATAIVSAGMLWRGRGRPGSPRAEGPPQ